MILKHYKIFVIELNNKKIEIQMSWFKKKEKNDWMVLHGMRGTWNITGTGGKTVSNEYCNYEILYSPSRDEVKIEMEGYKPKSHSLYNYMMKILGTYNEALLSNGDFVKIKKEIDEGMNKKEKEE